MKSIVKKAMLFVVTLLPAMIIGGLFTGIYSFDTYTTDMQNQMINQIGSYELLLVVGTIQSVIYGALCGFLGYILSAKTNLMKSLCFEKDKIIKVLIITIACGLLFSLDYWVFGKMLPEVAILYESKITVSNFIASVLYGGIVEEILMRLFLMSLVVFIVWKLFFRSKSKEEIPWGVFVAANVLTALLFAAGHLPATIGIFEELTPLVLLRCFLLNGGFGIVFGRLYRKYGIQYAMLGHMGCHIVSKVIWMIFV